MATPRAVFAIGLGVWLFAIPFSTDRAGAEIPADHGAVAPTMPRIDTPIVLDGKVEASAQYGDKIIVGGSFTQLELADGSIVTRRYLFAYDINTGAYVPDFDPVVDKEVQAIESADDGSGVFIAGKFNSVDGEDKRKVAKLDASGNVIRSFTANASAKVTTLDDDGVRLYLGGTFTTVNGEPRVRLAAVDVATGAVSGFRNDVTVDVGRKTGAVKSVDVSPDNKTLLVVHASAMVDGQDRFGVAQIDLTNDAVTPWRTDWYKHASPRCSGSKFQPRDGEYSSDGSMFVIVEKGGWLCDKAIAFPTADGPGLEENLWVLWAFDSLYSVGISDAAVYVAGHFCYLNQLGPIPTAQASSYRYKDKPESCRSGGNEDRDGISARYQIGAVDPTTGALHDWNPGVNVQQGVYDIEIIDRGVLLGMDRDQYNGFTTGRHAFLDFGGVAPPDPPDPPDPPGPTDVCTATPVANGTQLDWSIVEASPNRFHVRRDGVWITTLTGPTTSYTDFNGPAMVSYIVRYRDNGATFDVACV